jgi:hypothetical protein
VLALDRAFAGMTFVMCAKGRKSVRARDCSIARNFLALVAPRFTRPAAARGGASANFLTFEFGGISATSHGPPMFAAW